MDNATSHAHARTHSHTHFGSSLGIQGSLATTKKRVIFTATETMYHHIFFLIIATVQITKDHLFCTETKNKGGVRKKGVVKRREWG